MSLCRELSLSLCLWGHCYFTVDWRRITKCQSVRGTHIYCCTFRGDTDAQLFLCAVTTQWLRLDNSWAVDKQSKCSCHLNGSFIWTSTWDSLGHVSLKFPVLGPDHLRPELFVPFAWPSSPTDSVVITSTLAFQRGLWATHPLTLRVCSGGQTVGKWRQQMVAGEFVLC